MFKIFKYAKKAGAKFNVNDLKETLAFFLWFYSRNFQKTWPFVETTGFDIQLIL